MGSLCEIDNLEQLRWAHKSHQNKFSDFISIVVVVETHVRKMLWKLKHAKQDCDFN